MTRNYAVFSLLFLFLALVFIYPCQAEHNLSAHLQLLVVTSDGWESKHGVLHCFERESADAKWISVGHPKPVVLGELGMAWGIGLYPCSDDTYPFKGEGDFKSPAGIFSLGSAFGFYPQSEKSHLKIDYFQLNEFTVAVDDPSSIFYNCIVDSREVTPDWASSEQMREIFLYETGLVINHNFPQPQPGKGSPIFFHRWRHPHSGTAGCTALGEYHLEKILNWLEGTKNPVLVQFPYSVYLQLQSSWELPDLINN